MARKAAKRNATAGSLSAQVYQQLLDRIVDGRVRPGQLIIWRDVAAELGVSIAPVAETFASRDHEGLPETLPRKGTRARVFSPQAIRDQVIERLAIETPVARLMCGKAVRRHAGELRSMASRLDRKDCVAAERLETEIAFRHRLTELASCSPVLGIERQRPVLGTTPDGGLPAVLQHGIA